MKSSVLSLFQIRFRLMFRFYTFSELTICMGMGSRSSTSAELNCLQPGFESDSSSPPNDPLPVKSVGVLAHSPLTIHSFIQLPCHFPN